MIKRQVPATRNLYIFYIHMYITFFKLSAVSRVCFAISADMHASHTSKIIPYRYNPIPTGKATETNIASSYFHYLLNQLF